MTEIDSLIDQLMDVEAPFLKYEAKYRLGSVPRSYRDLRAAGAYRVYQPQGGLGQHEIDKTKYDTPFVRRYHINKVITLVLELIYDHNVTPEQIKQRIKEEQGNREYWRINQILDEIDEKMKNLHSKSKTRALKTFDKHKFGKLMLMSLYRPPEGSDEGGSMFRKKKEEWECKSKRCKSTSRKRKSKKSRKRKSKKSKKSRKRKSKKDI